MNTLGMMIELQIVIDIYRDLLKDQIETHFDKSIHVVEFYVNDQQFFIDISNNVYVKSRGKMGKLVGYLQNRTIFLGGQKN